MTGVEILAMEEVVVDRLFNWNVAIGSFGIMFGMFILMGVIMSLSFKDWNQMTVGIMLGMILGTVTGIVGGIGDGIPTEYEAHYKVVISDEVSMNDFLERYEIMDQEGKIYTVRERDGVENDN